MSSQQATRLRIKLSLPPRFLLINYPCFHKLTDPQKKQTITIINAISNVYLDSILACLKFSTQKLSSLQPSCTGWDSDSNFCNNSLEWSDIDNLIHHNPLSNPQTNKNNGIDFANHLVKLKTHSIQFCNQDSFHKIKSLVSNLNSSFPEPFIMEHQSITQFADKSMLYPLVNISKGTFLISRSSPAIIPHFVVSTLSLGLNFVPTLPNYPDTFFASELEDLKYRLGWKYFWHMNETLTKQTHDTPNSNRFLPKSLRLNRRNTPPDLQAISDLVNHLGITFKKEISNTESTILPFDNATSLAIKRTVLFFKNNPSLILKPADKGSGIVIMDRQFYTQGIQNYLDSSPNFFRKINSDPTTSILLALTDSLSKLKQYGTIDKKTFDILQPIKEKARCPYLYGLPKIHKLPVAFRPIVSGNGHPTERLSIFLDFLLQPFVPLNHLYLKDSSALLKILSELPSLNPKQTILFSLDVVGMYTNIPLKELITSIMDTIEHSPSDLLKYKNTYYKPDLVKFLLHKVLYNNFFQFNNSFYHQIHGIAMGTPCACSASDLFICNWMENIISKVAIKPLLYKQYRDDGFGIWVGNEKSLLSFVNELNEFHPTLKFTITHGTTLNYLDLTIGISEDGRLTTETFYKATDSFSFLHSASNHPTHCLNNIGLSQAIRHARNCSSFSTYIYHSKFLLYNLLNKGHNFYTVNKKIRRIRYQKRKEFLSYTTKKSLTRTPFILHFNKNMPKITAILRSACDLLMNTNELAAIGGYPIIGYRIFNSIGKQIIRANC